MNLRTRLSIFGFSLILISCSEKPSSEQDIFLPISERKKFVLGESGLVPEHLGSVSLDPTRTKGVIWNEIVHSLDSIFTSLD